MVVVLAMQTGPLACSDVASANAQGTKTGSSLVPERRGPSIVARGPSGAVGELVA